MNRKPLVREFQLQTDIMGKVVSEQNHKNLIEDFNGQMKKLIQEKEEQEKLIRNLKDRLRETNDELKRYVDRDRKNNAIIKKKNEELDRLQEDAEKSKKTHKIERKTTASEEACLKCKELEQ